MTPMRLSSRIHGCSRPNSPEFWALFASSSSAPTPMAPHSRRRRPTPALASSSYTGSDHEYHSLVRCQSSVQNSSARNEAGMRPRRTPARTLTW